MNGEELIEKLGPLVERIILRRLHQNRIDGYTLEMSREIAQTVLPRRSSPTPTEDVAGLVEMLEREATNEAHYSDGRPLGAAVTMRRAASALRSLSVRVGELEKELGSSQGLSPTITGGAGTPAPPNGESELRADRRERDSLSSIATEVRNVAWRGDLADIAERDAMLALADRAEHLLERLVAIIDWADYALSQSDEFDCHGVRNLDGPVFDAARDVLDACAGGGAGRVPRPTGSEAQAKHRDEHLNPPTQDQDHD